MNQKRFPGHILFEIMSYQFILRFRLKYIRALTFFFLLMVLIFTFKKIKTLDVHL